MEKSINYRLLGRLNFQNNRYNVYVDELYRKFYLKIIDCDEIIDLIYPTLEEFVELNKLFGVNYIQEVICFKSEKYSTKLSERKNIKFIPKLINKCSLISLAVCLSLTGCAVKDMVRPSVSEAVQIEDSTYKNDTTSVTDLENPISIEEMTDDEFLAYYNYPAEKLENGIYALNSVKINGTNYKICKNVNEFKKYLGIKKSPKYSDLVKAVKDNETITGRYEEWLLEAIENLSNNPDFDDVDFSVLLYNIERMQIREKTSEEIREDSNSNFAKAYFSPITKIIAVNPETVTQMHFLHESLGHASTQTITEENVFFESEALVTTIGRDENGKIDSIDNIMIGMGLEEGKADLLAEASMNYVYRSPSSYDIEKETVREFKETLGLSWADIINNSMSLQIIAKMASLGMEDPIQYVYNSDMLYYANMFDEIDDSIRFKNNMGKFFKEYYTSQMKNGQSSIATTKEIADIIQDSPYYPNYLGVQTSFPVDLTDMKEFRENVLSSIRDVNKTHQRLMGINEKDVLVK